MNVPGIGRLATDIDRTRALAVGEALLRESWPRVQVVCKVWVAGQLVAGQATFRLPGVVRVTLRCSGELIAQSLPGRPLDLDEAACVV